MNFKLIRFLGTSCVIVAEPEIVFMNQFMVLLSPPSLASLFHLCRISSRVESAISEVACLYTFVLEYILRIFNVFTKFSKMLLILLLQHIHLERVR